MFVLSLLVPLVPLVPVVRASCLPDAIPPAQRKILVNPNGERYPVGFFRCTWEASAAATALAATLVEEVLGYNTTTNSDNPGAGTVAGYYGITGCRTPNNISDRGCMQGVSYYHVHLESWMGAYVADWEHIQTTYSSMAPEDLGSMGYPGFTTMYISRSMQSQAYSTKGKALQFFRTWNASWNQPWDFFDPISAVDTSKLRPCNSPESKMTSDPLMRRYVLFTGDMDGVVNNSDVYSGRCDDGYFWLPPSCRANVSKCVPWLTGGTGWDLEQFMQKFTILNMPLAIGIAASWTDYAQLPLSVDMPFYWWSPDPTFLELNPMVVKFAEHNRGEFEAGLMTTSAAQAIISTVVSRDLILLAPTVRTFADGFDLPQSEMDAMLLEQKNTGETWEEVTCRWIKANRATWQKWIPDESECFPGFGLYDSVLQTFTDVRVNATNKIVCQACPPGTYSQKLEDDYKSGSTHVCVPCGQGTSQPSGASLSCTPCHEGEYQDEIQSTECKRCDFGSYQNETGQVACKACPATTNTLGFGSVAETDCGCPAGYIDMDKTVRFDCEKCGEGLTCPALSQLEDLENGESVLGEKFTPKIQSGYYTTQTKPTSVFRCNSAVVCPGGTPGSCGGGLVDIPCSQCVEGETWTGSRCEECGAWRRVLWVVMLLCIFAFLTLAYYLTTSKVTAKATLLFATTASFGMLVMSMQNLGLIGMMTVQWPANLQGFFAICQLLLLDIDSYGFSCVAGNSEPIRYLLSAMIFPTGVFWLGLACLVSRLFPKKRRWEWPKVCSTMGAFLQVGFSTMSATSLAPMMCYTHPNGQRSLLKYPGVFCGSADHGAMLAVGWTLLSVFVLGFVALCIVAVVHVPAWSAKKKTHLVAATRFLIFRFRLDAWWFGVPLLIRGPLLNLPVVLATDYPPIQVVSIAIILTVMMLMQMLAWPWKVPLLNLTDCVISFSIVLLVTTATLFLQTVGDTMYAFAHAVSTTMLGGIAMSVGIMMLMTVSALFYRSALGGRRSWESSTWVVRQTLQNWQPRSRKWLQPWRECIWKPSPSMLQRCRSSTWPRSLAASRYLQRRWPHLLQMAIPSSLTSELHLIPSTQLFGSDRNHFAVPRLGHPSMTNLSNQLRLRTMRLRTTRPWSLWSPSLQNQ